MLYYTLCLSYHSNTEAVLFVGLSLGWDTLTGRLFYLLLRLPKNIMKLWLVLRN